MAKVATKEQLLAELVSAVQEGDRQLIVESSEHPFLLKIYSADEPGFLVRVFIWNCTGGGGERRPPDEWRVQFTSTVPKLDPKATTLILGWNSKFDVFAGWDILRHQDQDSSSPSAQIKESTLLQAASKPLALQTRHNDEIVVAFRPEFFVMYATNAEAIHGAAASPEALALIGDLGNAVDSDIERLEEGERKTVVRQLTQKVRDATFRNRVLDAYGHRCAVCKTQMELVDAAHIIPVAHKSSTDRTSNGIALCKLHHEAFDRMLITIDEAFTIWVSDQESERLAKLGRDHGLDQLIDFNGKPIHLPTENRDWPEPHYLKEAQRIRGWR